MTTQWLDIQNNAARINEMHGEVQGAMRTALDKAITIGELLAQTKASLKHGEWGQWAEANLTFSVRTASAYIKLHEQRAMLKSESVSDLTTAYKMLREPQTRKSQEKPELKIQWQTAIDGSEECYREAVLFAVENRNFLARNGEFTPVGRAWINRLSALLEANPMEAAV